jgi:formate dehydrogenase maturation protein FdhE
VSRPPRGARHDTREIAELRALAERQPQLDAAASLQIDLVDALRRVQTRVATGSVALPPEQVSARLAAGQPLVDFDRLPIEWSEARLLFRQITDVLRRHDALDAPAATRLHDIGRSAELPELARRWFTSGSADGAIEMLDEVLAWSMRPFLVRAADVLQQRGAATTTAPGAPASLTVPFATWMRGTCPVCGGEPDFACITTTGDRLLVCGRCQSRWPTDPIACPYCGERDKGRITSFATPDGVYRVAACQNCERYVKTLDSRRAGRTIMPAVDAIATLPLDAVVMQRGFSNG